MPARASLGRVQALRWVLTTALAGVCAACSLLAARRPYADNQRNWLVVTAALAALALAAPLLLRLVAAGGRTLLREWTAKRPPAA